MTVLYRTIYTNTNYLGFDDRITLSFQRYDNFVHYFQLSKTGTFTTRTNRLFRYELARKQGRISP